MHRWGYKLDTSLLQYHKQLTVKSCKLNNSFQITVNVFGNMVFLRELQSSVVEQWWHKLHKTSSKQAPGTCPVLPAFLAGEATYGKFRQKKRQEKRRETEEKNRDYLLMSLVPWCDILCEGTAVVISLIFISYLGNLKADGQFIIFLRREVAGNESSLATVNFSVQKETASVNEA